jgi:hypothetical protein
MMPGVPATRTHVLRIEPANKAPVVAVLAGAGIKKSTARERANNFLITFSFYALPFKKMLHALHCGEESITGHFVMTEIFTANELRKFFSWPEFD